MNHYPDIRLRRLRRTAAIRRQVGMPHPRPEKFLWPLFIVEGKRQEIPIQSMPGQARYSADRLAAVLEPVVRLGVGGVLLFGVPERHKEPRGSYASHDKGLVQTAIRVIRRAYPDLLIGTDVCLCAYTNHGHCGVLSPDGNVDNDATVHLLGKMAVSHAAAGADMVAPSAMMDGQVAGVRAALNAAGHTETLIMSYSTKFASAMYGPFRDAAHSAPGAGDRRGYQCPYEDPRQALRESYLDMEEGADILMVKPALYYLDIIATLRAKTELPLAAYNVSGEYSMLAATAQRGWGDLDAMARESLMAIARSGADIIVSYWANQLDRIYGTGR